MPTEMLNPSRALSRNLREILETPVACLKLSQRVINALDGIDVVFVYQLLDTPRTRLLSLEGFGDTSLGEVMEAVRCLGLRPGVVLDREDCKGGWYQEKVQC